MSIEWWKSYIDVWFSRDICAKISYVYNLISTQKDWSSEIGWRNYKNWLLLYHPRTRVENTQWSHVRSQFLERNGERP